MSSLSAQLNTLNGQTAATTAHTDTHGRGFGFTANKGSAGQVTTEASAKHKATILYETARLAADIPTSLLRTRCHAALQTLGDSFPELVLGSFAEIIAGQSSEHAERGRMTKAENGNVDEKVDKLLIHLAPTIPSPPSLHVLEYLIRRYDVHARNAPSLILATLHTHATPLFSRILSLVNLTNQPVFYFLRPYAQPGAEGVTREALAKQASSDDKLLCALVTLAQDAGAVAKLLKDGNSNEGISKRISFATATVIEAIEVQTRKSTTNALSESAARCLLPAITSAATSECEDLRAMGYVLASCVSQNCTMGASMRDVVAKAFLEGAVGNEQQNEPSATTAGTTASKETLERSADAVLALYGMLFQGRQLSPPLPSGIIPTPSFKLLVKLRLLPAALGVIHTTRGIPVNRFVEAMLEKISLFLHTKPALRYAKLVHNLVEDLALQDLWRDSDLVKRATRTLITQFDKNIAANGDSALTAAASSILKDLHQANPCDVDGGIARAMETCTLPQTRSLIESTLGMKFTITDGSSESNSSTAAIPPRIALEHSNPETRLAALDAIMNSPADPTIVQSLFHRFLYDVNVQVAATAAQHYQTLTPDFPDLKSPSLDEVRAVIAKYSLQNTQVDSKKDRKLKKKQIPLYLEAAYHSLQFITPELLALDDADSSSSDSDDLLTNVISNLPCEFQTKTELIPYLISSSFPDPLPAAAVAKIHKAAVASLGGPKQLDGVLNQFLVDLADVDFSSSSPTLLRAAYAALSHLSLSKKQYPHTSLIITLLDTKTSFPPSPALISSLKNLFTLHATPPQLPSLLHLADEDLFSSFAIPALTSLCGDAPTSTLYFANLASSLDPSHSIPAQRALKLAASSLTAATNSKKSKAAPLSLDNCAIPALSLLAHPDRLMRKQALLFLEVLAKQSTLSSPIATIAGNASSGFCLELELDAAHMPKFLGRTVSTNPSLRTTLLNLMQENFSASPSSFNSVSTLLRAMEVAGDGSDALFPLSERWELVGKTVVADFVSGKHDDASLPGVLRNAVRMLRGVAGDGSGEGPGIITGASGRARKYSVSESSFVFPLPDSMLSTVLDCLKSRTKCVELIVHLVKKHSWCDNIFVRLPSKMRLTIARLMLAAAIDGVQVANGAFDNLPLLAGEVGQLLEDVDLSKKNSEDEVLKVTILAGYINKTSKVLMSSQAEGWVVLKLLFNKLALLMDAVDAEYSKIIILESLLESCKLLSSEGVSSPLLSPNGGSAKKNRRRSSSGGSPKQAKSSNKKELDTDCASYATMLIQLIKNNSNSSVDQYALQLLGALCDLSPSVTKSLLPALQIVTEVGEEGEEGRIDGARVFEITNRCLQTVVPSYCKNGDGLFELLKSFVTAYDAMAPHRRSSFYSNLVITLTHCKKLSCVGPIVACLLSTKREADNVEEGENIRNFCLALIQRTPTSEQVHAVLSLLKYAGELLAHVAGVDVVADDATATSNKSGKSNKSAKEMAFWNVKFTDLLSLAPDYDPATIKLLVCNIMMCTQSLLGSVSFPLILKNTKGAQKSLLEMWEKLQTMLGDVGDAVGGDDEEEETEDAMEVSTFNFFKTCTDTIIESLCSLQRLLDVPNFLTAAKILVDSSHSSLFKKSLVILGERAAEAEGGSAEQELFLDSVAEFTEIISGGGDGEEGKVTGLLAVAKIASALQGVQKMDAYVGALKVATVVLLEKDVENSDALWKSASLCCCTLVGVLKMKALPFVGKLVSVVDVIKRGGVKMPGVNVLVALAQHMPQFLGSHLHKVVGYLKQEDEGVGELVQALSLGVELRIMLPVVKKIVEDGGDGKETARCVQLLGKVVENTARSGVNGHVELCTDVLLLSMSEIGSRSEVSEFLVSVVMKLSEKQFRGLFDRVRSWYEDERGAGRDDEDGEEEGDGEKGDVFWALAATLSRELRTIFLPCLSTVLDDAVVVLEGAAGNSKKRKQRGGGAGGERLGSVLSCLESSLKADSFVGGSWTTAQDGLRFKQILKPVSKLMVTEGVCGSVVGLSVSLACAGGDELLWKNLNSSILEAAGSDVKEVQLAGLTILYDILESVGEEYLGLLPECLPTLSECLEENDLQVVKLGKKILSLAEDLSGESLDEYL